MDYDPERIRPKDSEVFRLLADTKKIKELCDYVPDHSLKEGLKKTIDWFSHPEKLSQYKPDIYNV